MIKEQALERLAQAQIARGIIPENYPYFIGPQLPKTEQGGRPSPSEPQATPPLVITSVYTPTINNENQSKLERPNHKPKPKYNNHKDNNGFKKRKTNFGKSKQFK